MSLLLARGLLGVGRRAPPTAAAALRRLPRLDGSSAAPLAQSLGFHSLRDDDKSRPATASRVPIFFSPAPSSMRVPLLPALLLPPLTTRHVRLNDQQLRRFSSRRGPWQQNDWLATAKTGALVLLGAGALVASTSRT